jgi:hypothetical protein
MGTDIVAMALRVRGGRSGKFREKIPAVAFIARANPPFSRAVVTR